MNNKKDSNEFDNAIEALYLQRKNSIEAPEINVEKQSKKSPFKMEESFSILALGSIASFGILAVIHHFSHLENTQPDQTTTAMAYVDTIDVERFDEDSQAINMAPKSDEIKKTKTLLGQPKRTFELHTEIEVKPEAVKGIILTSNDVTTMLITPNTFKDKVPSPSFKIMPSLSKSLSTYESGSVKLAYNLSKNGTVKNITIIQSDVHRDLEKSAKKALSQWRYPKDENRTDKLQVEFKFR